MQAKNMIFSLAVYLGILALAGGCADSRESLERLAREATQPGPYDFESTIITLVDDSRPTNPNREYPGAPDRTLVTQIWYPVAEPGSEPESYPLIVFCHGYLSFKDQSFYLTEHLASHGFVVVSPDFPLTGISAPGGPIIHDAVNQPGDVSFLIDTFLEYSDTPGNFLAGMIDAEKIGVTGHSLGGLTTILASQGRQADPRIKAAISLSPLSCFFEEEYFLPHHVPILFMTGVVDLITMSDFNAVQTYGRAQTPRYLVEILGGTHVGFINFDIPEKEAFDMFLAFGGDEDIVRSLAKVILEVEGDTISCVGMLDILEDGYGEGDLGAISADRQREISLIYETAFWGIYLNNESKWWPVLSEDFAGLNPDLNFYRKEFP